MSTSKIPMRGISKLLTNLDAGIRARLESAFVEAENLQTFHNDSAINLQQKRVLSSLVSAPVITVDTNTLGYDVHWPRLKDRLISFYEVQVSLDSQFARPQTFKTVDSFFSAEGVTAETFLRVRGVRWDGKCGSWSDIETVTGGSIASPVVYTVAFDSIPSFYREFPSLVAPDPIQHIHIVPQKQNGGIMVFGSFGVEFYIDPLTGARLDYNVTDPDTPFNDSLSVTINGARVINVRQIPVIQTTSAVGGSPQPFTCIGYSLGFGPAFLGHNSFYSSTYDTFPAAVTQGATHGANGTHDGWHNLVGAESLVETDIINITDDASYYTVTTLGSAQTTTTKSLTSKKHNNHIGTSRTVMGIEVRLYTDYLLGAGNPLVTVLNAQLVDNGNLLAPDLAAADPVPLSNLTTVPTPISFGGPTNLWGQAPGFWSPAKINNKNFGFLAKFNDDGNGAGVSDIQINVYGIEILVYTNNPTESADVEVIYIPATDDIVTYPARRTVLKNCTINAIEFGDDIT